MAHLIVTTPAVVEHNVYEWSPCCPKLVMYNLAFRKHQVCGTMYVMQRPCSVLVLLVPLLFGSEPPNVSWWHNVVCVMV